METILPLLGASLFVKVIISAFFAILFLQSGIDKITDWKGNLGWLTGHFAESPLKGMVPMMLGTILVIEVLAGALCGMGIFALLLMDNPQVSLIGCQLSATALTMLFFGQRIAKDYPGAASLVSYFILAILGVLILS